MPKKKVKKIKRSQKLPHVWSLIKTAYIECATYWRSILGVAMVYALLQFIFVKGLSFSNNIDGAFLESANRLSKATTSVISAFGVSGLGGSGSQSDATVLMQYLLFIIASMALVWTLRQLQNQKTIKFREAYYEGTSTLIPTILITCIFLIVFIPAALGSGLLSIVIQAGGSGAEVVIFGGAAGLLFLISLFLFAMLWPAFYIVSLPQTKPLQALKSAIKVTKKRRFAILNKMVALFVVSILLLFLVLFPIALVIPVAVPVVAYILLFISFGYSHVYLYKLYRSLL